MRGVPQAVARNDTLNIRLPASKFQGIKKRQVKSPKVLLADSGILHTLLAIHSLAELESHPKLGASWEGFVISQVANRLAVRPDECFFWATHAGAELDLLCVRGNKRWGFEVKRTTTPTMTPSMRSALADLKLQRLFLIHAGDHSFNLGVNVRALAIPDLLEELKPW